MIPQTDPSKKERALCARLRRTVYAFYRRHGRSTLPWRRTNDPYRILVSEIMLQQTQVNRVIEKYVAFLRTFPTLEALARAPVRRVLKAWQGLGYNRRAVSLREAARMILKRHGGKVPADAEALRALPGIGTATAASILAFAFNEPVVFIETNVRSVFIHHFFQDRENVRDEELLTFVTCALDRRRPRIWYGALMDYGSALKLKVRNPSRRSAHHVRQSAFAGSDRQIRGQVLRLLLERSMTGPQLYACLQVSKTRAGRILGCMLKEGLVRKKDRIFHI